MIDRAAFERDGFVAGIAALTDDEVARYRAALLDLYSHVPEDVHRYMINLHATLSWAADLARHPRILDAVAALIGADILLWKSKAFVKFSGPGNVGWHQDLPHWNLDPDMAVTAWVALSDVTPANGCVQVLPGTHQCGSRASEASADENSLLSAGLQFEVSDAEVAAAVPMALRPGEISLHHGMIVHGSGPNETEAPRVGIAFVYAPANVRQRSAPDRHVDLVRGQDRNGGFFPVDPPPAGEKQAQLAAAMDYFEKLRSGEIAYNVR
jgi:ectoine hydroxylase-related dioxygenase (phytanoyl-CoA dioxygenase family)